VVRIVYCEICNIRLTPGAFEMGDAVELDGAYYCNDCARQLQGRAPGETVLLKSPFAEKAPRPGPSASGAIRSLAGAAAEPGLEKVRIKCPRCNTVVTAELPKGSVKVVCGVCGTTLSVRKKRSRSRLRRRRRR